MELEKIQKSAENGVNIAIKRSNIYPHQEDDAIQEVITYLLADPHEAPSNTIKKYDAEFFELPNSIRLNYNAQIAAIKELDQIFKENRKIESEFHPMDKDLKKPIKLIPTLSDITEYIENKDLKVPPEEELKRIYSFIFIDYLDQDQLDSLEIDDIFALSMGVPTNRQSEEVLIKQQMKEIVHEVLDKIFNNFGEDREREKFVLKMTFGMNKEQKYYSPKEVGKILKLTSARIRQIQKSGLKRLQHPHWNNSLKELLD